MGLFGIILLSLVVGATVIALYQLKKMAHKYQLKIKNGSSKQPTQSLEKQNLVKLQTSFLNQTNSMLEISHMDSKLNSSKGFMAYNYSILRLCKCLLLVELSNCHTIHQMARGDYAYPMDMFNRTVIYQILILQIVSTISVGLLVVDSNDMFSFVVVCVLMTFVFMLVNYVCRFVHLYYKNRKNRINAGLFSTSLMGSQQNFYNSGSEQQSPLKQKAKSDLFEGSQKFHHTLEISNEPFLIRQFEQNQKINYLKLYRIIFFLFAQVFFSVICINKLFWTEEKYIETTFFFLFILIIADFFLIRPFLIGLIVWIKLIWIGCFRKELVGGILEKYHREKKMEEEMMDYRKKNRLKSLGKMVGWLGKKGLDQLNEEDEEESILKDELQFEEEERYEYKRNQDQDQSELENAVDEEECQLIQEEINKLRNKEQLNEEEQKRLIELESRLQKKKEKKQEKLKKFIENNMKEQLELQEEIMKLKNKGELDEEEQMRLKELERKLEEKQREEQQMVQQYRNEGLRQRIEREKEIMKLREKGEKEGLDDQEMKRLNWLEEQQMIGLLNENRMDQLKIQQEIKMLEIKQQNGGLDMKEQKRLEELRQQLQQKQKEEKQISDRLRQKQQEITRLDIEIQKKQKLQEQMDLENEIQRLREKGDLTEEEQKRLKELEDRLEQNKRELRELDQMEIEQKQQEYQMKDEMLSQRLKDNMEEQVDLEEEIEKLKRKGDLTEEEQKRLKRLEKKLEQKQKEQRHIQKMQELLEQQKSTELMRIKNRKEIEEIVEEMERLKEKGELTEEEQNRLIELGHQLEQKLDLDQQLMAIQKDQEYKMREMEDRLQSEDQRKALKNRKKELEKEQERIREQQRIEKQKIKALELEEIELQEEIQKLRNKGDLTEEEQKRLNELEKRLEEVQKEKMLCQQRLQLLYQEQQENQREQEFLKQQDSRIDELSNEEGSDKDWEEHDEDEDDSYERYQQYQYGYQQDFEMGDRESQQDQNVYLENNSNEHSLQTQNSNDVTQFNKQSRTLLKSLIQMNDSKNMTLDQQSKTIDQNKTNILEQVKESDQEGLQQNVQQLEGSQQSGQQQQQQSQAQSQQQGEQQDETDKEKEKEEEKEKERQLQEQFQEIGQDLEKNDLSQSQIKTNFNKELKFNMSLSMDQNSIFNQMENDVKDQQLATEQENQSDSQILQLNKIFQNNKSHSKSNSLNTRNISFSSKANLQGMDRNQNYLQSQKGSEKQIKVKKMGRTGEGFGRKFDGSMKGRKGENQFLVKTSTQMDIQKKGVEYSLDFNLHDNFQKLDFNEIERLFDKQKKKQLGHSNSKIKTGKKFMYIDESKFGDQMQQRYQDKSHMMSRIYNDDSRNVSQQSIIKKPLKQVKTFKKQSNKKQKLENESIDNFDYDAFLKEQDRLDALQVKKDQIKVRQPPKSVDKNSKKKKSTTKKKEKKPLPPPKILNGKSPYQEYLPKLIDKQVKEQKLKDKEQKLNQNKLTMMMSRNNDISIAPANQNKINKVANIYQNQNQSILHDANKSILSTNKKQRDNELSSHTKKQNSQIKYDQLL